MIEENIRELSKQEKEILLEKIRLNIFTGEDLCMINSCIEDELKYECICFLLELEDDNLKSKVFLDLKYHLKLEEVKDILNKISCEDMKDTFDLYMFHKEKYILEKALRQ